MAKKHPPPPFFGGYHPKITPLKLTPKQQKAHHHGGLFFNFGSATGNRTRVLRLRISRPNP